MVFTKFKDDFFLRYEKCFNNKIFPFYDPKRLEEMKNNFYLEVSNCETLKELEKKFQVLLLDNESNNMKIITNTMSFIKKTAHETLFSFFVSRIIDDYGNWDNEFAYEQKQNFLNSNFTALFNAGKGYIGRIERLIFWGIGFIISKIIRDSSKKELKIYRDVFSIIETENIDYYVINNQSLVEGYIHLDETDALFMEESNQVRFTFFDLDYFCGSQNVVSLFNDCITKSIEANKKITFIGLDYIYRYSIGVDGCMDLNSNVNCDYRESLNKYRKKAGYIDVREIQSSCFTLYQFCCSYLSSVEINTFFMEMGKIIRATNEVLEEANFTIFLEQPYKRETKKMLVDLFWETFDLNLYGDKVHELINFPHYYDVRFVSESLLIQVFDKDDLILEDKVYNMLGFPNFLDFMSNEETNDEKKILLDRVCDRMEYLLRDKLLSPMMTSEYFFHKTGGSKKLDNTYICFGYFKIIEILLKDILRANDVKIDEKKDFLGEYKNEMSKFINKSLFMNEKVWNETIVRLGDWIREYRNGFFHKDILSKEKIEEVRAKTFELLFFIIGGFNKVK